MDNLESFFAAARAVEVPLSQEWIELLARIQEEDESNGPPLPCENSDQMEQAKGA